MSKIIMISVGCLWLILGLIFLIVAKFPMMGILFFFSVILFIVSGVLSKAKKV